MLEGARRAGTPLSLNVERRKADVIVVVAIIAVITVATAIKRITEISHKSYLVLVKSSGYYRFFALFSGRFGSFELHLVLWPSPLPLPVNGVTAARFH